MTLSFNTIKSEVQRHLSVIGKRMYDKEGRNMFSNVTVSSDERPILDQYIKEAAQTVEGALRQLVTAFAIGSSDITLNLTNTRGAQDFDARCKEMVTTFIVSYTLNEYLGMTHPDISRKYQGELQVNMEALMNYAFYKEPPTKATYAYSDVKGTIET